MSLPQTEQIDEQIQTDLGSCEFHALFAAKRRRLALDVLGTVTGPIELVGLASEVAAREAGRDDVDRDRIERVAIDLRHVHVPKLADAGVLTYDPATTWIEPDDRAMARVMEAAETWRAHEQVDENGEPSRNR